MPELPEVETTKRGIENIICNIPIEKLIVRQIQLRWPVAAELTTTLPGLVVESVSRRAKYLLLKTSVGHLIIHLGMSGHLRVLPANHAVAKHDHIDLVLANGQCLRYHDPRRFGAWLWTSEPVEHHPLLAHLGPEPLSDNFNARYLFDISRGRKTAIKAFIMNSRIVVGVGNIYANESLFLSGLHPLKPAQELTFAQCEKLVETIRKVLAAAITQGGTTLKDFVAPGGQTGYFVQQLYVYDQAGKACQKCGSLIRREVHFQRASYLCPKCQSMH